MYNLRCTRYNLGEVACREGSPLAHVKGLRGKREGFACGSREGLAAQA